MTVFPNWYCRSSLTICFDTRATIFCRAGANTVEVCGVLTVVTGGDGSGEKIGDPCIDEVGVIFEVGGAEYSPQTCQSSYEEWHGDTDSSHSTSVISRRRRKSQGTNLSGSSANGKALSMTGVIIAMLDRDFRSRSTKWLHMQKHKKISYAVLGNMRIHANST